MIPPFVDAIDNATGWLAPDGIMGIRCGAARGTPAPAADYVEDDLLLLLLCPLLRLLLHPPSCRRLPYRPHRSSLLLVPPIGLSRQLARTSPPSLFPSKRPRQ